VAAAVNVTSDTHAEFEIAQGGEEYVLRSDEECLKVGQRTEAGISWFEQVMPIAAIGGEARRALEQNDPTCPALLIALTGAVANALTSVHASGSATSLIPRVCMDKGEDRS
jgi:hypothetical protein